MLCSEAANAELPSNKSLQCDWTQLPVELWTEICCLIASHHQPVYQGSVADAVVHQQQLLGVRLVCSKVKTCLDGCKVHYLVVPGKTSPDPLLGLKKQVHNHQATIQTVAVNLKSITSGHFGCQDEVPVAPELHLVAPSVKALSICSVASTDLRYFSSFTDLTKVKLQGYDESYPVAQLAWLKMLQELCFVSGEFVMRQLPRHLTKLCLVKCHLNLSRICQCVTSLQALQIVKSKVWGLHLSSCCALRRLDCSDCIVLGDTREQGLQINNSEVVRVPAGLAALTALTQLSMYVSTRNYVDLSCLSVLTSLQSLSIGSINLQMTLSGHDALSQLTSLTVTAGRTLHFEKLYLASQLWQISPLWLKASLWCPIFSS